MKALILGIGGQDGSYLADLLLDKGYEVHGMVRRSSTGNLRNIQDILSRVNLHKGDLADPLSVHRIIDAVRPKVIYNEADQDSVGWSNFIPSYSFDITAGAVGRMLESVLMIDPKIKVFQPCSAMMFGDAALLGHPGPQNELTPFNPQSPYACAKVAAYYLCRHYREQHGLYINTAILYNHDSPRRSEEYLLHKICKSVVRIKRGEQECIALGNLDARVEIGYARDYMEAAHAMMQLPESSDYVIGNGVPLSVSNWADLAFNEVMLSGEGRITVDPEFFKPTATGVLRADYTKAYNTFGYKPTTSPTELVRMLVRDAEGGSR